MASGRTNPWRSWSSASKTTLYCAGSPLTPLMCFSPLHSSKGTSVHSRNIRAGWAKAGLFPFNPDKVLSDIPDPPAEVNAMKPHEVKVASYGQDQDQVPPTPTTLVSAEAVASLHNRSSQMPLSCPLLNEPYSKNIIGSWPKSTTKLNYAERPRQIYWGQRG